MTEKCVTREMTDGIIELDSERAKTFGFSSDLYEGYLWKKGEDIYISFIVSKKSGEGNLSKLFAQIENAGFRVAVPTPLGKMESILQKKGFVPTLEEDWEVWRKPREAMA